MNVQTYADWNRFLFESLPQKIKKKLPTFGSPSCPEKTDEENGGGEGGAGGEFDVSSHIDI